VARLITRNNFSFPTGVATYFNNTHPAARGVGISDSSGFRGGVCCVAMPNCGLVDIINRKIGTAVGAGSVSFPVHGFIGPSLKPSGIAGIEFATGAMDGSGYQSIHAAIFSGTYSNGFYSTPITAEGPIWFSVSDSSLGGTRRGAFTWDGVTVNTANACVLQDNVPYFMMTCYMGSPGGGYWLLKNLKTGAVSIDTGGGNLLSSQSSGVPKLWVGINGGLNCAFNGNIAAVFMSQRNFLSVQEGMAWAENPWSLWYPDV
jgi:hypothetical protein